MSKPRIGYLVMRLEKTADVIHNGERFPADFDDGDTLGVCFVFSTRKAADECADGKFDVIEVRLTGTPK